MRGVLLRVAAATGVIVLTLMTTGAAESGAAPRVAAGVAVAARPVTARAAVASSPPALRLAGQTTTVSTGHAFSLELDVSAQARHDDHIDVAIYPALLSRIDFDEAARGRLLNDEVPIYLQPEMLNTAGQTTAGAVVATIPVGEDASGKDLLPFSPGTSAAGVYPLEVQLYSAAGTAVGEPLSTFLVYSPAATGFAKLAVSLTVGVNAPPAFTGHIATTAPSQASSAALSQLVTTIAGVPGVPVTLDVTPQTVDALTGGPPTDQATVTALAGLAAHGDELAPAPYVSVSLPGLDNAGLDSQADKQLTSGAAALETDLHQAPSHNTWVLDEPLGTSTLQFLMNRGLDQLILPARDLSALPAAVTTTTYAQPTELKDGTAEKDPRVLGADTTLSGRLAPSNDPVLAAEQTLAELAMIQLEAPSTQRGVAILAPAGQSIQPEFLHVLLAGLRDNPLVSAVTASGLFATVKAPKGITTPGKGASTPPATGSSGTGGAPTTAGAPTTEGAPTTAGAPTTGAAPTTEAPPTTAAAGATTSETTPPVVQRLVGRPASTVPSVVRINMVATEIGSIATMVPGETKLLARLGQQLLVSESDQIAAGQRRALLASAQRAVAGVESHVKLIGATSVTLTARNVHLPLTIDSAPKVSTHVQLVLSSTKLLFKAYVPPDGTCSSEPTSEICNLVLRSDQTTLKIPVEARTTGVFALDISVQSPDGYLLLASSTDTVRSTAISFVGWVLIFGAALFLGIWWIRDSRNGRRARQLVEPPDEDDDPDDGPRTDLRLVPPVGGPGVSPSERVGGHNEGAANRRNPEEIPT